MCFTAFRNHVAELVSAIVPTNDPMLHTYPEGDRHRCTLSFRNAHAADAAAIPTEFGRVYLHVSQQLHAAPAEGGFRLRTCAYRYALYDEKPTLTSEPLFRWEYETKDKRAHDGYPRHHLQFGRGSKAQYTELRDTKLDLNRVHLPTGWVLMEEVFRFLIHELRMEPRCGATWPKVLHDSETRFHEEFTTRSMTPSAG